MATFAEEYEALSKLLVSDEEVEDKPVSRPSPTPASIGPGGILPGVKVADAKPRKDANVIWNPDELGEDDEEEEEDGRSIPRYEFLYKQAVGTEHAFLGIDPLGKTPSSTTCEDLVMRIHMPGVSSVMDLHLDLKPTRIRLHTPKYKLSVELPHPVDEDKSAAKWDADKHQLSVTMRRTDDLLD